MRKAQLTEFIQTLVRENLTGDYADVADAILADDEEALARLAWRLNEETDGSPEQIRQLFKSTLAPLDDATMDWLAERADSPASYLYSQI